MMRKTRRQSTQAQGLHCQCVQPDLWRPQAKDTRSDGRVAASTAKRRSRPSDPRCPGTLRRAGCPLNPPQTAPPLDKLRADPSRAADRLAASPAKRRSRPADPRRPSGQFRPAACLAVSTAKKRTSQADLRCPSTEFKSRSSVSLASPRPGSVTPGRAPLCWSVADRHQLQYAIGLCCVFAQRKW